MTERPAADIDALTEACGCALRNVGHTHSCVVDRLARVELVLAELCRATEVTP
jgi:hypothetical protein